VGLDGPGRLGADPPGGVTASACVAAARGSSADPVAPARTDPAA